MSAQAETNEFAWWQAALANKSPPIHEGDPQCGYFRIRYKDKATGKPGPWQAACIYRDGGKLMAFIGNDAKDPAEVWTWLAKRPISYEVYTAVMDRGEPWPDDITDEVEKARAERPAQQEAAGIGHNARRPEEEIRDELDTLDKAFSAWLAEIGGKITTEEQDAKAETFRTRFAELEKRAAATHKAEKEPHLNAGREIDARFKPVQAQADNGKRWVGSVVTPYRQERERARQEAERQAREAERKAREEAARAAAEAEAAGHPAPEPVSVPQAPRAAPRPTGLRTYKVTVINDLPAVVAEILKLQTPPVEFVDAVKTIARRMLDAGVTVTGAEIVEEKRA